MGRCSNLRVRVVVVRSVGNRESESLCYCSKSREMIQGQRGMDPVFQAKQCKRLRSATGTELCTRAAGRTRGHGLREKGGNRMGGDGGVEVWITEGRKGRSGNDAKQNPKKGLDLTRRHKVGGERAQDSQRKKRKRKRMRRRRLCPPRAAEFAQQQPLPFTDSRSRFLHEDQDEQRGQRAPLHTTVCHCGKDGKGSEPGFWRLKCCTHKLFNLRSRLPTASCQRLTAPTQQPYSQSPPWFVHMATFNCSWLRFSCLHTVSLESGKYSNIVDLQRRWGLQSLAGRDRSERQELLS